MDYKLALALKKAGFPQLPKGRQIIGQYIPLRKPDLEELIDACGDRFGVLERFKNNKGWGCYVPNDCAINGLGKTPKEAVANLYLELKK